MTYLDSEIKLKQQECDQIIHMLQQKNSN